MYWRLIIIGAGRSLGCSRSGAHNRKVVDQAGAEWLLLLFSHCWLSFVRVLLLIYFLSLTLYNDRQWLRMEKVKQRIKVWVGKVAGVECAKLDLPHKTIKAFFGFRLLLIRILLSNFRSTVFHFFILWSLMSGQRYNPTSTSCDRHLKRGRKEGKEMSEICSNTRWGLPVFQARYLFISLRNLLRIISHNEATLKLQSMPLTWLWVYVFAVERGGGVIVKASMRGGS